MTAAWGGSTISSTMPASWITCLLLDLTLAQWRRVLYVNSLAPIEMSNAAVRRMARGSAIVNVSSVLGQVSAPTRGPYRVSKSALISLTKMQAIEWAEAGGIRVNAIAPGYIANETTQALAATGSFDMSAINRRDSHGSLRDEDRRWRRASASCWLRGRRATSPGTRWK